MEGIILPVLHCFHLPFLPRLHRLSLHRLHHRLPLILHLRLRLSHRPPSRPLPLPPPPPLLQIYLKGQHIEQEVEDLSMGAQSLRTVLLVAFECFLSLTIVVMGIDAYLQDLMSMLTAGVGGLIFGIGRSTVGKFVSMSSQCGIELTQFEREHRIHPLGAAKLATRKTKLLSLWWPIGALMLSRAVGGAVVLIPLMFDNNYSWRIFTLITVVTIASASFVELAIKLGKTAAKKIT